MIKKFQRKIENFICENCQTKVIGNGYTNHCPQCLCSKHLDINPGDRQSLCQGMMKPEQLEKNSIIHICVKCKHKKKNKISPVDNFENILKIGQV